MQCHKYFDLISMYLLDELDPSSKEELTSHLKSCPQCRQEMDEMKTVITALEDENRNQMTDSERLRLQNDIYRSIILNRPDKSAYKTTLIQPITKTAAAVLIFLAGYMVSSFLSNSEQYFPNSFSTKNDQSLQINNEKISLSNYRITKEGLKVIAKGKKAILDNE